MNNVFYFLVDHTRVILTDGDPDDPKQDYINASYIDVSDDWYILKMCLLSIIAIFFCINIEVLLEKSLFYVVQHRSSSHVFKSYQGIFL